MGDFNALLHTDEKQGGLVSRVATCKRFQTFLFDNNLKDLGFKGPKFTWCQGRVHELLDGVLYNASWERRYQFSSVYHLQHIKFDHWPLLFVLNDSSRPSETKTFKFLFSGWLFHSGLIRWLRCVGMTITRLLNWSNSLWLMRRIRMGKFLVVLVGEKGN